MCERRYIRLEGKRRPIERGNLIWEPQSDCWEPKDENLFRQNLSFSGETGLAIESFINFHQLACI